MKSFLLRKENSRVCTYFIFFYYSFLHTPCVYLGLVPPYLKNYFSPGGSLNDREGFGRRRILNPLQEQLEVFYLL